jgi:hypothetical protein
VQVEPTKTTHDSTVTLLGQFAIMEHVVMAPLPPELLLEMPPPELLPVPPSELPEHGLPQLWLVHESSALWAVWQLDCCSSAAQVEDMAAEELNVPPGQAQLR